MEKTYTLELTAEELEVVVTPDSNIGHVIRPRLFALREQARADRERDDLRLPWEAFQNPSSGEWYVAMAPPAGLLSQRACKLMSAAPELLEAVKAAQRMLQHEGVSAAAEKAQRLIDRALRKVETGIPEGP